MYIREAELKDLLRLEREALLSELSTLLLTRKVSEDKKLSSKEAASFLGISLSTLYKNVSYIPHKKFGKKLVFIWKELHDFDFSSIPEKKERFR